MCKDRQQKFSGFDFGPTGSSRIGGRRGFTLIELLVSVAVVVILAAILIVGIGRVRVAAGKAEGTSNLRQLGAGLQMYANANNGELTPFSRITHFAAGRPPLGGRYTKHLHAFLSGGEGLWPEYVSDPSTFYHPLDDVYSADPFFDSKNSARWSFHAFGMNRRMNELIADHVLIKDRGSGFDIDKSDDTEYPVREDLETMAPPFRQNSAARAQGGALVLFGDFHVEFIEGEGGN